MKIDLSKPWMSPEEIAIIESYLHPKVDMLEWGAGGSTIHFSRKCRSYASIEQDAEVAGDVSSKVGEYADVYHMPPNGERMADTPSSYPPGYENSYWAYITAPRLLELGTFDCVLIDGRARLFCAREAMRMLKTNGVIFIHDWSSRPRYHAILEQCKLVRLHDKGQTLAVLKAK